MLLKTERIMLVTCHRALGVTALERLLKELKFIVYETSSWLPRLPDNNRRNTLPWQPEKKNKSGFAQKVVNFYRNDFKFDM